MARSLLVLIALLSAPAWAVGERISFAPGPDYVEQLRDAVCISMECSRGGDADIKVKTVKGRAEIKVVSPGGAVKGTVSVPLNDDGRLGSMELVAAVSGIIQAIEGKNAHQSPEAKAEKPAKKSKAKSKRGAGKSFAARHRVAHSRG